MPNVTTVGAQVMPVMPQIALISADVSSFAAGCSIVPFPQITPQLMPVAGNVAPVRPDVPPVCAAINSVMSQVSPEVSTIRA